MCAEPTCRQRMVVRDAAASGEARQHGRGKQLGDRAKLVPGARHHGAATRDEERSLGTGERRGGPRDEVGLGRRPLRPLRGAVGRPRDLGVDEVARDVDQHRAGPPRAGDREGLPDDVGDEVGAVDAYRPLRDRGEHPLGGDLLRRPAMGGRGGASTGEHDDRQRADVGLGNPGEEIRAPGAGRDEADTRCAGELRLCGGHARRRVLVAHEDVPYLGRVVERVVDPEDMTSGQTEHGAHALGDERVDDRTARRHRLQRWLPTTRALPDGAHRRRRAWSRSRSRSSGGARSRRRDRPACRHAVPARHPRAG